MIISSAAHLEVCNCGSHGHIQLANGTIGPEVASKEVALLSLQAVLRTASTLQMVLITEEEIMAVKNQIENSSLPEELDLETDVALALASIDVILEFLKLHEKDSKTCGHFLKPPNTTVQ